MNEIRFRQWLADNGYDRKVASDTVSRLKKLETTVCCDVDQELERDGGQYLLSLFEKKGENPRMQLLSDNQLPVGKYYLSTYKYALRLYMKCDAKRQNG